MFQSRHNQLIKNLLTILLPTTYSNFQTYLCPNINHLFALLSPTPEIDRLCQFGFCFTGPVLQTWERLQLGAAHHHAPSTSRHQVGLCPEPCGAGRQQRRCSVLHGSSPQPEPAHAMRCAEGEICLHSWLDGSGSKSTAIDTNFHQRQHGQCLVVQVNRELIHWWLNRGIDNDDDHNYRFWGPAQCPWNIAADAFGIFPADGPVGIPRPDENRLPFRRIPMRLIGFPSQGSWNLLPKYHIIRQKMSLNPGENFARCKIDWEKLHSGRAFLSAHIWPPLINDGTWSPEIWNY